MIPNKALAQNKTRWEFTILGSMYVGYMAFDPAAAEQRMIDYAPLKRIAMPVEISHGVLYLASYEARFVTGASLPIDGGTTAGH